MRGEGAWKHPLATLTRDARVHLVVVTVAALEATDEIPTQREIAAAMNCSEKWSDIDQYLAAAREGYVSDLLHKGHPLLRSAGPFNTAARGDAVYRVTKTGHKYLAKYQG
jgi:hypothetical protein